MNEAMNVPYSQFCAALAKPGAAIVAAMTPEKAHMLHMAVGLSGEAGEALSAINQHIHFEKELDRVNLIEELGDLEFYAEGLRQACGLPVAAVGSSANPENYGFHGVMLSVDAADLLDAVKKHVIYNKPLDADLVEDKLLGLHFEMGCVRVLLGVSREEVIAANKQKLGVRYSSGSYSDKQAQDRADKKEIQ